MTDGMIRLARHPVAIFLLTGAAVTLVAYVVLQPRLGYTFPSMIDDWAAISRSPHQIWAALTLRNPETLRYRPGFIVWNYLQWHTFGGPARLVAPSVWGILRVTAFVFGVVGAAFVLSDRNSSSHGGHLVQALLAGGGALAVTTIPHSAVDLARYGPQEPLMIGLMCGGAALLTVVVRRDLAGRAPVAQTWILGVVGLILWVGGTAQKETSVCALVLIPFVWIPARTWLASLPRTPPGARRRASLLVAGGLIALLPMLARVVQLSLADTHVYGAQPNKHVFGATFRQLAQMPSAQGSVTGMCLVLGAVALIAVRCPDWIAIGLLLAGVASLAFTAQTPFGPTRYFLPIVTLSALAVVRLASTMPRRPMFLIAALLATAGVVQVQAAHRNVSEWVKYEREQQQIVRAVAERRAAGCSVDVAGSDIELITAVPVLERFAGRRRAHCSNGDRFLALITGSYGPASADRDPALAACGTRRVVVLENTLARIFRCPRLVT
jgi:hypothetical protein